MHPKVRHRPDSFLFSFSITTLLLDGIQNWQHITLLGKEKLSPYLPLRAGHTTTLPLGFPSASMPGAILCFLSCLTDDVYGL